MLGPQLVELFEELGGVAFVESTGVDAPSETVNLYYVLSSEVCLDHDILS